MNFSLIHTHTNTRTHMHTADTHIHIHAHTHTYIRTHARLIIDTPDMNEYLICKMYNSITKYTIPGVGVVGVSCHKYTKQLHLFARKILEKQRKALKILRKCEFDPYMPSLYFSPFLWTGNANAAPERTAWCGSPCPPRRCFLSLLFWPENNVDGNT